MINFNVLRNALTAFLLGALIISCTLKRGTENTIQEVVQKEDGTQEVKTIEILEPEVKEDEFLKTLSGRDKEIVSDYCYSALDKLPGKTQRKKLRAACSHVKQAKICSSTEKRPIFHYQKLSGKENSFNILVFALVHGDEFPSGSVARAWMERLEDLDPRSNWRIIPIANPDGLKYRWRPNANKVDINRNFPTKNWDELAVKMWKKRYKSSWRKFPGPSAASEVETRCLIAHIDDFKPDFIISIHTPLGHLDFDGPKLKYPKFNLLPWREFGNFPGSLGRYMWRDNGVPVLTIELKGGNPIESFKELDSLQDISGTLAIKALEKIETKKSEHSNHDH